MRSCLVVSLLFVAACGPELVAIVDEGATEATAAQALVAVGFDPGMRRACARSPQPGAANGLTVNDHNECAGTSAFWLLGNHAERDSDAGVSCTGSVASQSYPWVRGFSTNPQVAYAITGGPGSPKTWDLKTDGVSNPPACGTSDSFHWNTLMLQRNPAAGVNLPDFNDPDASSRMTLWYNDYVLASSRSRLMVGAEVCYAKARTGATANPVKCRQLEVNLTRTNWRDTVPTGAFAIQLDHSTAAHPDLAQYVQLDGAQFACNSLRCFDCVMSPGSCAGLSRLTVGRGSPPKQVFVNWNFFLGWAISTGQFDPIDYSQPMHMKSINVATETNNRAIAHMQVSGFFVEQ